MAADPSRHFHRDFKSARAAFLRAAEARGARIGGASIGAGPRGPQGEELAVDTAYLGPDAPETLLAVSSGVHGVEGHTGSAVQHRLLCEQLDGLDLPGSMGLLLVHAVNPYGFAHTRRVNESNVDLNRNFLRHPDEHVPNPDYDTLYDHINPSELDEQGDAAHVGALLEFGREHGIARLQEVLTCGQYAHPTGVQFGGVCEEASNKILREVTSNESRGARKIGWVDVHTGLGPYAEVEMITELETDDPGYLRGRLWYGDRARSTRSGESASAALNGTMELGVEASLPTETELTIYAAEFGTYEPVRVFRAMRADNWLEHHGDPESEQGRAIKHELLEVFRPADPAWQSQVLDTAARVLEQTRDGLLR